MLGIWGLHRLVPTRYGVGALLIAFAVGCLACSEVARAEPLAHVQYEGHYSESAIEEEPRTKGFFSVIIEFDFHEEGSLAIYDPAYARDYQPAAHAQTLTITHGSYDIVGAASQSEGCKLLASPTFDVRQDLSIWAQTLLDGEVRLRAQGVLPTEASAGGLVTEGRDCPTVDPPTSMIEGQLVPYDKLPAEADSHWREVNPSVDISAKHLPADGTITRPVDFHFADPSSLLGPAWVGTRDTIDVTGTFTASFPRRPKHPPRR